MKIKQFIFIGFMFIHISASSNDSVKCRALLKKTIAFLQNEPVRHTYPHTDKYANFRQLKKAHKKNQDYSILKFYRNSPVTVIVPHGGRIEEGVTDLAFLLAGNKYNLYVFYGKIKFPNNFDLHITSTNFDEPMALSLMKKTEFAISIHGYNDEHIEQICIGGGNSFIGESIATSLISSGFTVEFPCKRFPGKHENNIINRAKLKGVQLELTSKLRRTFSDYPEIKQKFLLAVRNGIE